MSRPAEFWQVDSDKEPNQNRVVKTLIRSAIIHLWRCIDLDSEEYSQWLANSSSETRPVFYCNLSVTFITQLLLRFLPSSRPLLICYSSGIFRFLYFSGPVSHPGVYSALLCLCAVEDNSEKENSIRECHLFTWNCRLYYSVYRLQACAKGDLV